MASTCKEDAVGVRVEITRLIALVKSFAEIRVGVFPVLLVLVLQPIGLLRQPIWLICASLRNYVDFKAGFAEDIEWM